MGSPAAARQREGLRLAPGLEAALLPNQHLPAQEQAFGFILGFGLRTKKASALRCQAGWGDALQHKVLPDNSCMNYAKAAATGFLRACVSSACPE